MATADRSLPGTLPLAIGVHGARHNNLRNFDVDVPLWRTVAVVGVSGSGKTSLAMGTLYAEGMQRYLAGLSTYSRRRLTQARRPDVDRIDHLPPALALRQRVHHIVDPATGLPADGPWRTVSVAAATCADANAAATAARAAASQPACLLMPVAVLLGALAGGR
jgi:ApbE family